MQASWARLAVLAMVVLIGTELSRTSPAYADDSNGYTKRELSWHLGERAYFVLGGQFGSTPGAAEHRAALKRLAAGAGVVIPPMPSPRGDTKKFALAYFNWERSGAGSSVRRDLTKRHGADCGALFELAFSSHMLLAAQDFSSRDWAPFVTQMRRAFGLSRLDPELFHAVRRHLDRRSKPFDVHMALQSFQRAVRVTLKKEDGTRTQIGGAREPLPSPHLPWLLGISTCLASTHHMIAEITGKPPDPVLAEIMTTIRAVTEQLGVPMPKLPRRGRQDPGVYHIKTITYVLSTWGPQVVTSLRSRFGPRYGYLFEIPVKAGWIAQGGEAASNEQGRLVANYIKSVAAGAELPRKIWGPFVSTVELGGSGPTLREAMFKMNSAALEHLEASTPEPKTPAPNPASKLSPSEVEAAITYWELGAEIADGIDNENMSRGRGAAQHWPPLEAQLKKLGLSWPAWPATISLAPSAKRPGLRIRHVMSSVVPSLIGQIQKRHSHWHSLVFHASYKLALFTLLYRQEGYNKTDTANLAKGLKAAGLPDKLWGNVIVAAEKKLSWLDIALQRGVASSAVLNHFKAMRPAVSDGAGPPEGARSVWRFVLECFDWAQWLRKADAASGEEVARYKGLAAASKKRADDHAVAAGVTLRWPHPELISNARYKWHTEFSSLASACSKQLEKNGKSRLAELCRLATSMQLFRLGVEMEAIVGSLYVYLGPDKPMAQRQADSIERSGREAGVPPHFYESLVAQARRGTEPLTLVKTAEQANQRIMAWLGRAPK